MGASSRPFDRLYAGHLIPAHGVRACLLLVGAGRAAKEVPARWLRRLRDAGWLDCPANLWSHCRARLPRVHFREPSLPTRLGQLRCGLLLILAGPLLFERDRL